MLVNAVKQFIDEVKNLNVLVVGETIIDEFIEVTYEGQSMKSMCPVFKLEGSKTQQQGGAEAIASHLKDFVKKVDIITNTKNEIVKTRYIDINDAQKHAEVNKFDTKGFNEIKIDTTKYDVVIIADFGHGFCDKISINHGFHLMCQTNSNNFGFNRISKWKKYKKKSACIDLREASLQVNKRIINPSEKDILEIYNYELNTENLFVTTGKSGAFYTNGKFVKNQTSFKTKIVDTIGAGDTFYAFACLNSSLKEAENPLLIPALAASLSTTWLCNAHSITKENLLAHAISYI
jgi:bifunctional ADP-heptose synthase (sugar kinase/adenylyltransferase)